MIKQLLHNNVNVLIYEVTGTISKFEETEWTKQLNVYIKSEKKVRILLILGEQAGWSFKAGVEDFKWLITHLQYIEKMAIVSDSLWWKWYVKLDFIAKIFGTKERWFSSDETDKALEWVSSTV